MTGTRYFDLAPMDAPVGAEVSGLDLAQPQEAGAIELLRQALDEHGVLRFRGQNLSDEHLMQFSRHFGTLDLNPGYAVPTLGVAPEESADSASETRKYVAVISNVIENGVLIGGLGDGEAVWHADMTYVSAPPAACLLYALEVPPSGGNTGFLSLAHAYETLDPELRARLDKLQLKHDATYNSAGELRRGVVERSDPRHTPGRVHSLVVTHPRSGRKMLLLGRRRNAYLIGLDLDESNALLDAIWAHVTQTKNTWYQQWKVGDVIFWDNLATMHRRDPFPSDSRRIMHRTQILGTELH